jgi:DNA polymerase-1
LLSDIELPLAGVLADMEAAGFEVDTRGLADFGTRMDTEIARYQSEIYALAGEEFNLNSPKQLGVILFEKLGLPTGKKTKTKSGYSTNAEVLESLANKHPIVSLILEYRKVAKLKSTYVEGLLKVVGADGRIHTSFQQTLTRTGRISSTEPNLQNIPIRTEMGSELRRFFRAGEGNILLDADYSQIELRVLAHIAHDQNMIEAFQSGADIHRMTASQVFDMPPDFVTPAMRRNAKAVNFGIVYGIGAYSLAGDIHVSVAEADQYIKSYLETYKGVRQYMEETIQFATENGYVTTLFGRRRYLPELASSNYVNREFGKRVAMNTTIQGTAADIIKIAMVRVYERLKKEGLAARLILQVHDELIVECPLPEADRAAALLREEMEAAVSLSVPMEAEVGRGRNWLEAK